MKVRNPTDRLVPRLIATCMVCLGAMSSKAAVTNITSGGPLHTTIAAAVTAAGTGDTLLVSTGTYAETVVIAGETLRLDGGYLPDFSAAVSDPRQTVIEGTSGSSVVVSNGAGLVFERLQITGGTQLYGGGLLVMYDAVVTGMNSLISGNTAWLGGGAATLFGSQLVLTNTVVRGNTALIGGGLFVGFSNAMLTVSGPQSDIEGNSASISGGGIGAVDGQLFVEGNAEVVSNTAGASGGGIYVSNATCVVRGYRTSIGYSGAPNMVTNSDGDGGGIYAVQSSVILSGRQCRVANNRAARDGGGVYVTNGYLLAADGVEIGRTNTANTSTNTAGKRGGGVFAAYSQVVLSNGSYIAGCASFEGGGLYAHDSQVELTDALVGDGVYSNVADRGGGVAVDDSTLVMRHSRVRDNHARIGGGVALRGRTVAFVQNSEVCGNHATAAGGGVLGQNVDPGLLIDHTAIVSNFAGNRAGGVYLVTVDTLIVSNGSQFSFNVSSNDGGGIWLAGASGVVSFADTEIAHNVAADNIGGILLQDASATMADCCIDGNRAGIDTNEFGTCGGLYVADGAEVILSTLTRKFTVRDNTAWRRAGGIYVDSYGKLEVSASAYPVVVAGNHAQGFGGGAYAGPFATVNVEGALVVMSNTATHGAGLALSNQAYVALVGRTGTFAAIEANAASGNGGGVAAEAGSFFGCLDGRFRGNVAGNLGGALFINASTAIVGSTQAATPTQPAGQVEGNEAEQGAGIYVLGEGKLTLYNNILAGNRSTLNGGALYCQGRCVADVINCIIVSNRAPGSAGVGALFHSTLRVLHSTIVGNSSNGVTAAFDGTATVSNSIVTGNTGLQVAPGQIVRYSDIEGGYSGAGNFDAPPLFRDPGAMDYRLEVGSPCVDTGAVVGLAFDVILRPRPMGTGYDLGAFEQDPWAYQIVSPRHVEFGELVPGETTNREVTVANGGIGLLSGWVTNLFSPVFAVASGSPYSISGLSNGTVVLTFAPVMDNELYTNVVTFVSIGGKDDVMLTGTGVPEPLGACGAVIALLWAVREVIGNQ